MTSTMHVNEASILTKHHENMMQSLNHRIAAAKAAEDRELVELLERERQQLVPTIAPTGLVRSLDRGLQTLKQSIARVLFGDTKLRVYQYQDGRDSWWYAFDPQTGHCVYADSEAELQRWIDDHYQGN